MLLPPSSDEISESSEFEMPEKMDATPAPSSQSLCPVALHGPSVVSANLTSAVFGLGSADCRLDPRVWGVASSPELLLLFRRAPPPEKSGVPEAPLGCL